MESIDLQGIKYISSKRAAKLTGYTTDYIGQLCRDGKISAQRVGRSWYVDEESLLGHKEGNKRSNTEFVHRAVSKTLENEKEEAHKESAGQIHKGLHLPEYRKRLLDSKISYESDEKPLHPELTKKTASEDLPKQEVAVKDTVGEIEISEDMEAATTLSMKSMDLEDYEGPTEVQIPITEVVEEPEILEDTSHLGKSKHSKGASSEARVIHKSTLPKKGEKTSEKKKETAETELQKAHNEILQREQHMAIVQQRSEMHMVPYERNTHLPAIVMVMVALMLFTASSLVFERSYTYIGSTLTTEQVTVSAEFNVRNISSVIESIRGR